MQTRPVFAASYPMDADKYYHSLRQLLLELTQNPGRAILFQSCRSAAPEQWRGLKIELPACYAAMQECTRTGRRGNQVWGLYGQIQESKEETQIGDALGPEGGGQAAPAKGVNKKTQGVNKKAALNQYWNRLLWP